jgi:hypothetical protein
MVIPAQAVLCQLENVRAPVREPWTARTSQQLKDLVDNKLVDVFPQQTFVGEVGRVNKQESKLVVTM